MVETKRQKSKWRMMWSAMGLATLLLASAAKADFSVSVTSGGVSPDPVEVGQNFSVTFSSTLNSNPPPGLECTASNQNYNWTVTVSGPSGSQTYTNPSGGSSYTLSHTAGAEGTYSISASVTVSYQASAECGGNGSKSGSAGDSVEAFGTICPDECVE